MVNDLFELGLSLGFRLSIQFLLPVPLLPFGVRVYPSLALLLESKTRSLASDVPFSPVIRLFLSDMVTDRCIPEISKISKLAKRGGSWELELPLA